MKSASVAMLLACAILISPAAAHTTKQTNDRHVTLTYGLLDEPVTTYQRTGLELCLNDGKGNPIKGVATSQPAVNITLTYGAYARGGPVLYLTGDIKPFPDRPGCYTYPLVFTTAGSYSLHVHGPINGTIVNIDLAPDGDHAVTNSTQFMFPVQARSAEQQDARIAQLEADIEVLRGEVARLKPVQVSPGLAGVVPEMAVLLAAGLFAARRLR